MMERLTRPTVEVDETAAKYMGKGLNMVTMNDRLLELILNGPTLMAVPKDHLRHIIRQLYGRLKEYEDAIPAADAYTEEDVRNAYTDGYSTGMAQGMGKAVRHERWDALHKGDWTSVYECSGCHRRITVAGDKDKTDARAKELYPYCQLRRKNGR